MNVKIKKMHEGAVIPYKTHAEDMCYDVVATSCEEVAANVYKYGIGLAFQIDPCGIRSSTTCITLKPRSSIWKTGMVLSNSVGTIDELYTGQVYAVFYHVMKDMPIYKVGDRVGQINLETSLSMNFTVVNELDETARGGGGYGSTGE